MSARKVVHEALERFGRGAGLEKKSGVWYRRSDEVIAVSDLQKSQYGEQYYFNQGFWLRQLEDERYPKGWKCHISLRLETLVPERRHQISRLLNLDEEMPDTQRIAELVELWNLHVLPLIERGSSIGGLRGMLADGTLRSAGITGPGQQVLGIKNMGGH